MKPVSAVSAALCLAACAAVGCSKGSGAPETKALEDTAPMPQVLTGRPSVAVAATDGEESAEPSAKPTSPASFADGEAAYHAGKYADAAAIFDLYTTRRPENAWGHYMLGLSAWKSGDLARSDHAFEKALSIDPRHVKSLVNSSRVLIEQKRFDEAVARLNAGLAIEPAAADIHRLLGRAHAATGGTDEAIAAYQRAIDLDGRDAWSLNNLALLLLEAKRPSEALPLLTKAVELRKDVPVFHNNLGMALEHTGRYDAAVFAYQEAVAVDPGYEKAVRNLARIQAVTVGAETKADATKKPTM